MRQQLMKSTELSPLGWGLNRAVEPEKSPRGLVGVFLVLGVDENPCVALGFVWGRWRIIEGWLSILN